MPATADFTHLTRPLTSGNAYGGWWNIELPWPIYFLRTSQYGQVGTTNIHVTSDGVIAEGFGSNSVDSADNPSPNVPSVNKLMIAADTNILTSFTYKIIGTSPNRKAYMRYEGRQDYGNNYISPPIIWEVVIPEQSNFQQTFVTAFVVENSRWPYTGNTLYGLYNAFGTLIENPANFGQPGINYKFDFWDGGSYARTPAQLVVGTASIYNSLPSENLAANRTLFISGNSTEFGAGTGVMMIANPGLPIEALSNPLAYTQDLYFHSGLPYVQIIAVTQPALPMTFPAVNRGYIEWSEGGGKGK